MSEDKDWSEVNEALEFLYTPEEAALWMTLPNRAMADRAPRDCESADVLRMLRLLLDGAYI